MVFKSCILKPRFQQSKRKNNPTSWGRDINQTVPKIALPNQTAKYSHNLVNFSAPRSRIIFPFALLESWFQDANFEYHKPYLLNILNFHLKGGTKFFRGQKRLGPQPQKKCWTKILAYLCIKATKKRVALILSSFFQMMTRPNAHSTAQKKTY